MPGTLAGKTALVTGASRGIGRATALELARRGAHVIALARTQGGLEELDDAIRALGGHATLVPFDISNLDQVDALGPGLFPRFPVIDVFVGNAAILGPLTPLAHLEAKEWDKVMLTNVTAQWRLLRTLDPLVQRAEAGRVVMISSGASWKHTAFWGPYGISKAALNALTLTYASETATTAVKVNLFNPGPIRTNMRAQAMPGENPETLETPDGPARAIADLCLPTLDVSGKVYDYPSKSFKSLQVPA